MLLPFFEWCEATALGLAVRESVWLFPAIEAVHLLGLCLLGGALLIVDLRMLGAGLTRTPVALLARQARPWLVAGVVTMLATGVLLFLSEAIKCYYSQAFWVKITTLPWRCSSRWPCGSGWRWPGTPPARRWRRPGRSRSRCG